MKKKCIFICIFNNIKYIDLTYLLLESLYAYGNLDNNTEILIYTSTEFMQIIRDSKYYVEDKIKFVINDNYNTLDTACKSRLDLFEFPIIQNYSRILYLDSDVLIVRDVNTIFELVEKDVIYALEEGSIDGGTDAYGWDYWGTILFGDDVINYADKSAFSSGVMLFNNCEKIKDLFCKIKETIIEYPYTQLCYDQPYIVYNAFKYNLYDNKVFKKYVAINDYNIFTDKTILHFAGGVGVHQHKIINMQNFLYRCNIARIGLIVSCGGLVSGLIYYLDD
jgi:hypothetical protein